MYILTVSWGRKRVEKKGFCFPWIHVGLLAVILLSLSPKETGSGLHSITKLLHVHFVCTEVWKDWKLGCIWELGR